MSDSETDRKTSRLEPELRDMKIEPASPRDTEAGSVKAKVKVEDDDRLGRTPTPIGIPTRPNSQSGSRSPVKHSSAKSSSSADDDQEKVVGGDITLKMEPGKAPKLSRAASQKVLSKPPPLYLDLPDATDAAKQTFGVLPECTYASKYLGNTEHALECDCSEEWGKSTALARSITEEKSI